MLTGAPFSFSVGSGNANNRVELTVPTEQAWQLFIADANFELPESVVVLFAHEAQTAPPAHLNTPDDIYLARRRFPPTVVEGVGLSYIRVVVEDGCVLLRNEWTEQLDTLIVPPHLFLHADSDSDALVLLSSEGDVVAVIGQTPICIKLRKINACQDGPHPPAPSAARIMGEGEICTILALIVLKKS